MSRILKFHEATAELQRKIAEAKEKLLSEILSDTELSKVEKLQLISENQFYGVYSWLQDIFIPYKKEYIAIVKANPAFNAPYDPIIDDYFTNNDYDRHQTIDLSEIATNIDELYFR